MEFTLILMKNYDDIQLTVNGFLQFYRQTKLRTEWYRTKKKIIPYRIQTNMH